MTQTAAGWSLPLPAHDSLGSFYWRGAAEGVLLIQRCSACGLYIHYPRPVCRACLSRELSPTPVSGQGTLHSFTVMMQVFHPFFTDRLPYVVASVELPEQERLRVLANVVDCPVEEVRVGMPVEVTFRQLTPELTIPQFRPRPGWDGSTDAEAGR